MMYQTRKVLSLAVIAAMTACDGSATAPDGQTLEVQLQASTQGSVLAEARAATARFHNVDAAIAAGYVQRTPCLVAEGIRYGKQSLIFDGVIDSSQPELLIYVPTKSGHLRLAAVQYLVPASLWDATNSSPPSLGDQPFMDRRSPPFGSPLGPNYSIVAWVWMHNPSGMYELFNPAVTCE
ncbi:MAG TPA: hypothetical protein VM939_02115 [Gemmatimonadaceae bacterium]|nr:hypothetical protein [Gemmatimonadaceae bacterium]